MFGEIKSKGIKNLCVDLRENGGGNSLVANEFLKYLDIPSYKDMGLVWRLGFLNISAGGGVTENERYEELTCLLRITPSAPRWISPST